jgi:hypothetical protein
MNIRTPLLILLPKAIAWAEAEANAGASNGQALTEIAQDIARTVGVAHPELIRLALVDALPMPQDPMLQAAAVQTGFLGPHMAGLTLGHSVFVRRGYNTSRLLSHEFRHVFQYEQAGSIAAFLSIYLQQVMQFGYMNAPLELDARAHEQDVPSAA